MDAPSAKAHFDSSVAVSETPLGGSSTILADLFHWKNPMTTGCVLGALNASFFLFAVLGYSACSLICHAALFFMGFGLVVSLLLKSSPEIQRVEIISEKQVEENMLWIYDVVNDSAGYIRHVLLWHDMTRSLKVVGALFASAWVASWISFPVLFFMGTWALFTQVYVLDAYRTHLEPLVRPHMAKALEAISVAYSKIPRMADSKKLE